LDLVFRKHLFPVLNIPKNINLNSNGFYLIKESCILIKGLSGLMTQKTIALVEILDQICLARSTQ
jgi:hypothetical protein